MSGSKVVSIAGIFAGAFWMIASAAAQSSAAPDAEHVAKIYMTAFFAGDIKDAADLTDPRTLDRIREAFISDLLTVTDPDQEKAILTNLGVAKTTADLGKVDVKALYIALTEADRRRTPQVFETMKRTRVEILGSTPNPTGGVTVRLRIITPTAGGTPSSQESGLLMRQVLGGWKVVGNAP